MSLSSKHCEVETLPIKDIGIPSYLASQMCLMLYLSSLMKHQFSLLGEDADLCTGAKGGEIEGDRITDDNIGVT